MPKVYLAPSNQVENRYAYGDTTEAVQCGKIAEACKAALERSGVTVQVGHMIHMSEKIAQSNAFGADLHVPIHTNAFNGTVTGTRMFCFSSGGEGMKACKAIFARLAPITPGTSESIQVNDYDEIVYTNAPAAYVECEFHDNAKTAQWIVEHTTDIGEAIAQGICDYFGVTFKEKEQPAPAKSVDEVAREVIRGEWGNGSDRRQRLEAAGYDYDAVQDCVNELMNSKEEPEQPTEPTPTDPVKPAPEPEQPATDKLYRVQVGAFAVRENAERMLQRLKDAGFEGFIREG